MILEGILLDYDVSNKNKYWFKLEIKGASKEEVDAKIQDLDLSEPRGCLLFWLGKKKYDYSTYQSETEDKVQKVSVFCKGSPIQNFTLIEYLTAGIPMSTEIFDKYMEIKQDLNRFDDESFKLNHFERLYIRQKSELPGLIKADEFERAAIIRDQMYDIREKLGYPVMEKTKK